ncbi:hypothetical protein DL96DRAFT_1018244 [Flagelloscypha sp. PMI_526]|nr:hypothetical protein DL96DRAFT_1018244 [Flagelloscypha sp. PMI_526]
MSKNNYENQTPANTQFLSDIDIRRSIECLSFFLSGLRPGTVQRHELNPTGVALMHFATLLSGNTRTAAVTGSISISRDGSSASAPEFRGIISIAENSRETGDLVECSVPERFEISAKTQNEEDLKNKFLRLIEEKNHANVPLQDHVEDLLTLHSLFNKKVVNLNTVHQFIHLRALSRLRARFGAYKSLWKTNLLIMLEQWSPQSQDASFSIKMRNLRDSHPQWRALLDSRGYPKANTGDPNARHVHFSATDCQMLLRFLVFSLRRAMLQAETNELDLMISNLRVVYAIVLDPALESLFTQTSLYDSLQSKEKHPAVERLKTNDNEIMEPLEQNEDEEDGRQEIESMEEIDTSRNLAYPLQYIKALTAWCAAIDYFFDQTLRWIREPLNYSSLRGQNWLLMKLLSRLTIFFVVALKQYGAIKI